MIGALLSATLAVGGAAPRSPGPAATAGPAERRAGPAGSVLIVESNRTVPLVHVVVASRSGAAADPRHREGLTNLAAEWARHNVRVNALAPGYVKTEMAPVDDPRFKPLWIDDPPMGRYALPEEMGPSVVYLASDASSFMTGSVLVVDGGYTLW